MAWDDGTARAALRRMFAAAVAAADPRAMLAAHLPPPPGAPGRVIVLGAGKAAAPMAVALEAAWPDQDMQGSVVCPHGAALPTRRIEVIEAAHPVPDDASARAGARMLELAATARPEDLVLVLLSGGGSSLLAAPAGGLTLEDKQKTFELLLRSGADITAMNTLRKHISAVKGGRLAAACNGARVVTLAISDVPGDDPSTIASGPTVADPTDFAAAQVVLDRYPQLDWPAAVRTHIARAVGESIKPGDPLLARAEYRMIATPLLALEAAAVEARALGLKPVLLGDALQGEARLVGRVLADIARGARLHGHPAPPPCVLLSGGETTVTLPPGVQGGAGGRCTDFALGLAAALDGLPGVWTLAADTDGIDGRAVDAAGAPAAGAIVTPDSLARARARGIDPAATLAGFASAALFDALGDLVVTGPTLTNVNDFRAILIG